MLPLALSLTLVSSFVCYLNAYEIESPVTPREHHVPAKVLMQPFAIDATEDLSATANLKGSNMDLESQPRYTQAYSV